MNTFQRIGASPNGHYINENDQWRHATDAEAAEFVRANAAGEGNPNHPMYDLQLFGYHYADFMRRQYK